VKEDAERTLIGQESTTSISCPRSRRK
jgi:hypothetical protein